MASQGKSRGRAPAGQLQSDLVRLCGEKGFLRFLFEVGKTCGMWAPAATGSAERSLVNEARRNLGLEIFQMCEDALGVPQDGGQSLAILTAVLLEAARTNPPEGADEDEQGDAEPIDRTAL